MTVKQLIVGNLDTNCYILKTENIGIIIDPGAEPKRIIEAVAGDEIILILATHRHYDHITALKSVREATNARAAIHPLDWMPEFDLKLEGGQKIGFGQHVITVIHTPGHTPGGCCFFVEDILFSGDTLFLGGPGNTSFPGGSELAILKSIREKLLVLPDHTIVYPGHGPSTTIGKERSLY